MKLSEIISEIYKQESFLYSIGYDKTHRCVMRSQEIIAALKALNDEDWVSVEDRLPEIGEDVLATCVHEPEPWVEKCIRKRKKWFNSWESYEKMQPLPVFPTHWRPLPVPPKTEPKNNNHE